MNFPARTTGRLRSAVARTPHTLLASVKRGISFLVRARSTNGPWRDFDLEPGVADAWVTAYAGIALLAANRIARSDEASVAVREAAGWLLREVRSDGSWGYNASVPSDSDSTAHTVLLLDGVGNQVPTRCREWLLKLQNPDGGISTFHRTDGSHSWGLSHPDVTPVVLTALLRWLSVESPPVKRGLNYVLANQGTDGLWRSFWWATPLYGTLMSIRLLESTASEYSRTQALEGVASFPPTSPFDAALLGEIVARIEPGGSRAKEVSQSLAACQLDDGSWPSKPMLRVTDPRLATPWDSVEAGPLASDQNRIFTTATVVRALSVMMSTARSTR